jgi:hypothetical protein
MRIEAINKICNYVFAFLNSQGFSDPVNVSLLGVAIADISGLSCLLWLCVGTNPYLIQFVDLPYVPEEFIYTTAGKAEFIYTTAGKSSILT